MVTYRTAPGRPVSYGYTIGMLCAEWNIPFIPGDLNNASTFDFPVRYLTVEGAAGANVLSGSGDDYAKRFVEAAQQLESEGVRAITGNCGYMAAYQREVADSVQIPVFLSSLLQAPLLAAMLGAQRRLGVLVAVAEGITEAVLEGAGIAERDRLVIQGLDKQPHFNEVILQEAGALDESLLAKEVVATARDLIRRCPDVGALLLECSDLPPYAEEVHRATGLPVFDWAGFIRYVHEATAPRNYAGNY